MIRIVRYALAFLAVLLLAGCSVPDDMLRAMAYGEIADARVRAGDPVGARDAALLAVETAEDADGEGRAFAELGACVALLRAGYPNEALHRAEALPDPKERLVPLAGLARALATHGLDREAAYASARIKDLLATLPTSENEEFAAMALLSRSAIGDFGDLPRRAAALSDQDVRNGTLAIIAEDQAAAGDFSGALSTTALIGDGPETAENELYLVGHLLEAVGGDSIVEARDLLFDSQVPVRIIALNRIALHQARQADFAGAVDTLAAARDHAEAHYDGALRAQGMVLTAMTLAVVGDEAGALDALARADTVLSAPVGEGKWEADRARTFALAVRDAVENGKAAEAAVKDVDFAGDPTELLIMKTMALVRLNRTVPAAETLAFAASNSDQEGDSSVTAAGYAILADRQAVLKNLAGAERSARQALSIAETLSPNSEGRVTAMYFATVALVRAERLDLAQTSVALIEHRSPEPVE